MPVRTRRSRRCSRGRSRHGCGADGDNAPSVRSCVGRASRSLREAQEHHQHEKGPLPMPMHALAALPLVEIVAPIVIALLFIVATSACTEPHRQHFMAIMLAGAGAAYL